MSELTFPCDSCGASHSASEVSDAGGYCPQCDADYDERKMLASAVSSHAALEAECERLRVELSLLSQRLRDSANARVELAALKAPAVAGDEREAFQEAWSAGEFPDAFVEDHALCLSAFKAGAAWQRTSPAQAAPAPTQPKCQTCSGVGIVGHSDLCPECGGSQTIPQPADGLVEALEAVETLFAPYARDSTQKDWLDKARDALAAHRAGQAQSQRGGE